MTTTLDDLLASGGKSLKFETPGETYTGTVMGSTVRQMTEFGSGRPLTFDNGDPQQQIVLTLKTDLRDPSDPADDGTRSLYIKGFGPQLRAFRAAVQAAGGKPENGDTVTVTFTGYGERSKQGGYPPKTYSYEIKKNGGVGALLDTPASPAKPTPAPAPQAAAATQGQGNPAEQAKQLIALNLTDEQIHSATGLDMTVIAALRAA